MDDPMLFWYCAAFFLLGGIAGAVLAMLAWSDRIQRKSVEEDRRRRRRKLEENGRTRPRHPQATGSARVTRANPRKSNRKR